MLDIRRQKPPRELFFRNSNDPCLHNTVGADAAVATGVRQVKDLGFLYMAFLWLATMLRLSESNPLIRKSISHPSMFPRILFWRWESSP